MQNPRPIFVLLPSHEPPRRMHTMINNQIFTYDEMVTSDDGTRYYIRYLDRDSIETTIQAQPKMPRFNIRPKQQAIRIGSTVALRQPVKILPKPQNFSPRLQLTPPPQIRQPNPRVPIPSKLNQKTDECQSPIQGLKCGICQEIFNGQSALVVHMEGHRTKNRISGVTCPCGKIFIDNQCMLQHQRKRLKKEGVKCDVGAVVAKPLRRGVKRLNK